MSQTRAIAIVIAALLYVLMPVDAVPDFWPLVGWVDDLVAAALGVYVLFKTFRRLPSKDPGAPPPPAEPEAASEDPRAVLGVAPGASDDEVRRAYREKIAQYHPDKVAHLGPELQRVAQERTLAIQRAYESLMGGRS